MTQFTPLSSLLGGALIGLAATLAMLGYGRVAGASGILRGLLFPTSRQGFAWSAFVLIGMLAAGVLLGLVFGLRPNVVPPMALWQVGLGGLIVGIGVTMAGGCTSGHGICGLARFSPRSLVAVVTFMATAFVTVFLIRHGLSVAEGFGAVWGFGR